jgi:glycosyltransferase involved in cell wall biosynthesis
VKDPGAPPGSRCAVLLAKAPDPALLGRIEEGREPRVEYVELARRLGAEIIDFHSAAGATRLGVRTACARGGALWGLAWLGYLRHGEFDHLYLTGEDIALRLGMLLRVARRRERITAVFHQIDTPKRRALLRGLGHSVFAHVIVLSAAQRRVLIDDLGFPAEKVVLLHNWIDHRFYAPRPAGPGDHVLAVGMESRDYPTLQAAAVGLPFRLRVVASGWSPGAGFSAAGGIASVGNVTVGSGYDTSALRDLYAAARFVVLPLKRVTYAAGVTAALEAMAMAKAIVTTDSPGLADYIHDRRNALVVAAGDVAAMRAALLEAWEHPELTTALGAEGRRMIEAGLNTDDYVDRVAALLNATPSR